MMEPKTIKDLTPAQLKVLWLFLKLYNAPQEEGPEESSLDEKIAKETKTKEATVRSHIATIIDYLEVNPKDLYPGRYALYIATKDHLNEIEKILGLSPRHRPPVKKDGKIQENFIIYRNLGINKDWFNDFYKGMELKPPQLGSELLYYGPGLARNWLETSESEYEKKRREKFNQCVPELLDEHFTESTNLIDLGVGDFQMACLIIEYGLKRETVPLLNYYPLDISYEMIFSSLLNKKKEKNAKILSQVWDQKGKIVAMNTSFTELYLYYNLFCEQCKNIYLLLGNTIGNEFDPVHTLQLIRRSMSEEDILIIEFQLIEDETLSDREITDNLNKEEDLKKFYKGAFLAVGGEDSKINLSVLHDTDDDGSTTYSFMCNFPKEATFYHPAFKRPISVPKKSNISVYVVNKFTREKVESILDRAGFRILSDKTSEFSNEKEQRFLYAVVQLKPIQDFPNL